MAEPACAASPLASLMTLTFGGESYSISWTDEGGGSMLTAGDRFRVAPAGSLSPDTAYAVLLLWWDGSILRSAEYRSA